MSAFDVHVTDAGLNPLARRSIAIARGGSALVALVGIAVLVGWLLDYPALTSLFLPGPTLKTNAAICLASGAVANLLLLSTRRRFWGAVASALAALQATIGALTFSQHLVGWNLGIDELLATEPLGAFATMSPNRMGPPASIANVLIGLSLLLIDRRWPRARHLGHVLVFVTCLVATLPVIGYAYGLSELYAVARYTGIAMVTAVSLLVLAASIGAGRPEAGIAALLARRDEVGVLARRLILAGVLMPFAMGWMLSRLYANRVVDGPFAISAMALVMIVVLAALTWNAGMQLASSVDARIETEQALSENERSLRESDQQKSEFLATLSHELRNPLAPMRFAIRLLDGPPETAARARQTIERQVQHLTRLIDDLLDLTRISRNKMELHLRPCELAPLVRDATDSVAGEIQGAGHTLTIDLPPEPVWLQADPERVVQMLVNLLTNAIRYSEPNGSIAVSARIDRATAVIAVRDSGHGIAAADLPRIFERFVQLGASRRGGLGIGLALVKAIAELHGGAVEADSEGPGRGAEFRIRLPRRKAPVTRAVAQPPRVAASRRILIVDDNRDAADMLGELLKAHGHSVAIAYDGEGALQQAASFAPQVGLLDIGMEGMDGYELAARLRRESSSPPMLVAITGWGQEEDRRRALSAGFDAHLTKPADPAAITALLEEHFQVKR